MELNLDHLVSKSFFDSKIPIKFVDYNGSFLTDRYKAIADFIDIFEVRDDDVWVCTFPKAGTTWTQEMVWLIGNDLDFEGAKVLLTQRFPFIESATVRIDGSMISNEPNWDHALYNAKIVDKITKIANLPSPRFIKTHLPYHLLPRQLRERVKKAKIIHVTRNPKDTCISYYYHNKIMHGFCGSFEIFCQLFLGDKVLYAPYWDHVNGYLENKSNENILFLRYEDMKDNLSLIIRKTADFLGKTLSDRQIENLEDHLNFSKMKSNPSVNYKSMVEFTNKHKLFGENVTIEGEHIRSGVVGQWRTSMSEDLIKQFDDWIERNLKRFKNMQNVIQM